MIHININKSSKKCLLVILSGVLLATSTLLSGCADDQARAQLADINSRLSKLEAENANRGTTSSKQSINTLNKLDNLQSQINQLNGNVSTISNNQKAYQATQDQLNQSIQQQVESLEQAKTRHANEYARSMSKHRKAGKSNGYAELKIALRKMKHKQFNSAIKILKKIIANPGSTSKNVVADAQYYLSIAYAANGQYKSSIGTARHYVNKHPHSKNAPDALRIMYISQKEMGWNKAAAKTKHQLIEKYPHSQAAKKVSAK